jgi:methionyl-tRNA formyltransferase
MDVIDGSHLASAGLVGARSAAPSSRNDNLSPHFSPTDAREGTGRRVSIPSVTGGTRIVFFGTPAFAVPSLEALVEAGLAPRLVVTQPARAAGRRGRLAEPPVGRRGRELGLEVEPVERVRAPEFLARLDALEPDLGVVVAFGQIFPPALLDLPRLGCVNLHASLLPRWRGAGPRAAAIAAGDAETGVTVQRMEAGVDTGPVYAARATPIGERETTGELAERLARLGAGLLVEVVAALARGEAVARPQDAARATHAPKLSGVRRLDPSEPAEALARQVRAYGAEPGAALVARGEPLKLLETTAGAGTPDAPPGRYLGLREDALTISAGDGTALEIRRAQRPGGRPLSGRDLANGLRLVPGEAWVEVPPAAAVE